MIRMPSGRTVSIVAYTVWLAVASSAAQAQQVIRLTGHDRLITGDFEEVYQVGTLQGEPWEVFDRVRSLGFDARGNLYVFDRGGDSLSPELRVLVFDSLGGFVREFGSRGEGPGEFKTPTAHVVTRDGTTIVRDEGHLAYQVFDQLGETLRMVRNRVGVGGTSANGLNVSTPVFGDPRGAAVYTTEGVASVTGPGDPEMATAFRRIVRHGLDGEEVQPETMVEAWNPRRYRARRGQRSSIGMNRPSTFEPALLMALLPDGGIVYSDSSAYAINVVAPDGGGLVRRIERPFRPEPVTPSVEDEYRAMIEKRRAEGRRGSSRGLRVSGTVRLPDGEANREAAVADLMDFMRDFNEIPPFYPEIPVVAKLKTSWEGRIWVMRQGEGLLSDGPIDVLTGSGGYISTFADGSTPMPDAFGPDGLAAFIELDEMDVARVVVSRLPARVR